MTRDTKDVSTDAPVREGEAGRGSRGRMAEAFSAPLVAEPDGDGEWTLCYSDGQKFSRKDERRRIEAVALAVNCHDELVDLLARLGEQVKSDLASAHAEICKLQGLDPKTQQWPSWTPQANTLRWIDGEISAALSRANGED